MSSYSRSGQSKYSLKVHLIFVTKDRFPIFCDNDMNTYMETDKNHIHEQRSCE